MWEAVGVVAADSLALLLAVVLVVADNLVVAKPLAVVLVVIVVLVFTVAVFWWPPNDTDRNSDKVDLNDGIVAANDTMRMEEMEDAPSFWTTLPTVEVVVVVGVVGAVVVVVLVVVELLLVLEELLAISREMGDHKYEAMYEDDFSWCYSLVHNNWVSEDRGKWRKEHRENISIVFALVIVSVSLGS